MLKDAEGYAAHTAAVQASRRRPRGGTARAPTLNVDDTSSGAHSDSESRPSSQTLTATRLQDRSVSPNRQRAVSHAVAMQQLYQLADTQASSSSVPPSPTYEKRASRTGSTSVASSETKARMSSSSTAPSSNDEHPLHQHPSSEQLHRKRTFKESFKVRSFPTISQCRPPC
jgi:hypothetical protein